MAASLAISLPVTIMGNVEVIVVVEDAFQHHSRIVSKEVVKSLL